MTAVYENKTVCFLFIIIVHLLNNFTKKLSVFNKQGSSIK